jgi:hypothetical protein
VGTTECSIMISADLAEPVAITCTDGPISAGYEVKIVDDSRDEAPELSDVCHDEP